MAISSNDSELYQDDSPENMKELMIKLGVSIPYLYDITQDVAKKFMAECTPEFYLFNKDNILVYRGRLDDSSPRNGKNITGYDLRNAIGRILLDKEPVKEQFPSMGCSKNGRCNIRS